MTAARRPAHVVDMAIAAGAWAFAGGTLLLLPQWVTADPASFGGAPVRGLWLAAAVITTQALALLFARRRPGVVLCVVSAAPLAVAAATDEATFSLTRLALLVAAFLAGLLVPLRHSRPTLILSAVLLAGGAYVNTVHATELTWPAAAGESALQTVATLGVPLLLGLLVAARRDAGAAHSRELDAVARERDALVAAAASGERAAMARELHDIAAHHLSGIAVMAAAVDRLIDIDPDAARRSVRQIRAQTRAVLDDLRGLVGLLRENTGERGVETLATVAALVADRQAAGMAVDLRIQAADGAQPLGAGVGPLAQVVAYRMVQEALANAATHAPSAPCAVVLDDRAADAVVMSVTNGPTGHESPVGAGGFGLIGMRERADLVAATLTYGRTEDGGWAVTLRIPRDRSAGGLA